MVGHKQTEKGTVKVRGARKRNERKKTEKKRGGDKKRRTKP